MKRLITLGHGPDDRGRWDAGATGNGTTEADWLRGKFYKSLVKYAAGRIDFYTQNMYANRDALTIKGYDDVTELHLDAAAPSVKGGHVIIYKDYRPDAQDNRLAVVIQKHFGLRGGKAFSYRSDLFNLNTFTDRRISYRLLELGFITNKANMDYFKKNYDIIARDLISAILNQTVSSPASEPVKPSKKANEAIAHEVIAGKWGNGAERTRKLNAAGYNAVTIQNAVNELVSKPVRVYTVKRGDSLSLIAKQFKTTVADLKAKNGIKDVNKIAIGQKIKY